MPCNKTELKKFLEEGNKLLQEVRECGCGEETQQVCKTNHVHDHIWNGSGEIKCGHTCCIKEKEKEEWPQKQDTVHFINGVGETDSCTYEFYVRENYNNKRFLGIFREEAEAQLKLSLVKALCPSDPFIPKKGERVFSFKSYEENSAIMDFIWNGTQSDLELLAVGNIHKTREQAEAYGKVLSEYANSLVKK